MATLVIFDFDWSLVEENSDTWVIQQIGADQIYRKLREQGLPWTQLMDQTLAAAASQLGVGAENLRSALHSLPFDPGLAGWVRQAAGSGSRTEGVRMVIVR